MKLYNINNPTEIVSLQQAVFQPLAQDRGLYLPINIPALPPSFFSDLQELSFLDIAREVTTHLLSDDLSSSQIDSIVTDAFTFPVPLVSMAPELSIAELFHGPTLAFKDFAARFMARLMITLRQKKQKVDGKLYILVATSGDTGGAVASGFDGVKDIEVVILFPKDKVSALQQKQLTTNGSNIHAIVVDGTFDDCQRIVKDAFLDTDLLSIASLSSANSINIARLLPQSLYYFEAYKQAKRANPTARGFSFVIPSGNYGNLCGGLLARELGLPVSHFIAGNNINSPVLDYHKSGIYHPYSVQATLSNAMDIGDPSNFPRLLALHKSSYQEFVNNIYVSSFSDDQTVNEIVEFHDRYNYLLDPHTAIGTLAAKNYHEKHPDIHTIVLSTAHPCKFVEETYPLTGLSCPIPEEIMPIMSLTERYTTIDTKYESFKKAFLNLVHFGYLKDKTQK